MTILKYTRNSPNGGPAYGEILIWAPPGIVEREMLDAQIESRMAVFTTPDEEKIRIDPRALLTWLVEEFKL